MKDKKGFWDGFVVGILLGFIGAIICMFNESESYSRGAGVGFLVQAIFIILPLFAFNCELANAYL